MSRARRARTTEGRDFGVAIASALFLGLAIAALAAVRVMTKEWDVTVVAFAGELLAGCAGSILFIRDPNKVMFDVKETTK